jgi:type III pantothenate kinase
MSVLAIDIGNSRIGLNVFQDAKAVDPAQRFTHLQIADELDGTLTSLWSTAQGEAKSADDDQSGVVIASVVPELTTQVAERVKRVLGQSAQIIGRDFAVPVKSKLRDTDTVGVDRLLGALCAYVNTEKACVIVQAGSALVVDCIDDEGIFRGGAILPGLQMSAKALHQFTAALPTASLTPPDDAEPFGRYTQEAINLGLYIGARGAIRELIERFATALGNWPHVVATGGDAGAVLADTGLVDSLIPDLVLQGAAIAWESHRMQTG